MRVIYNKANSAVLACGEVVNGDVIVDPGAAAIFPEFNGLIHGTFTFVGAPLDLQDNLLLYQVDDVLVPTTVIYKNHIQIVLGATSMIANGQTQQTVTFNILDTGDVLQNVAMTLDITATGGFLQKNTVAIAAGTGTAKFIAGNNTQVVNILAKDDNRDPITDIGGVNPVVSDNIQFVSSAAFNTPFAGVIAGIGGTKNAYILFNNGSQYYVGMSMPVPGTTASQGYEYDDLATTVYEAGSVNGDLAGVASDNAQFAVNRFRRLAAQVATSTIIGNYVWCGMSNGPVGGNPTPGPAFGFVKDDGDSVWTAYYNDGATSDLVVTAVNVTAIHLLEIVYDPDTAGGTVTFYIDGTQVLSVPGVNVNAFWLAGTNLVGAEATCNTRNASPANVISLSGLSLQYV